MAENNSQLRYPSDQKDSDKIPFVTFISGKYKGTAATGKDAPVISADYKTNEAITLYVPDNYSEAVGSTWGTEDIFDVNNFTDAIQKEIASKISGAAPKIFSSTKAQTGKAIGPKDLLLFKTPNPFTLNFNYNLVPRSKDEGDNIVLIVNKFKKSVLPTYDTTIGKAVLNFPDIWKICFKNINSVGDPTKTEIGIYENMALTNVNATYSAGSTSILTFEDGNPVQVGLSLTFQSIEYPIIKG